MHQRDHKSKISLFSCRGKLNIWKSRLYRKSGHHPLWRRVNIRAESVVNFQSPQQEDWDSSTAFSALKHFERLVETTRMTLLGPGCRETLTAALDTVIERTQDFTDSAYTSHEHRENILLLCDRAQLELNTLLRIGNSMVRIFLFSFSCVERRANLINSKKSIDLYRMQRILYVNKI